MKKILALLIVLFFASVASAQLSSLNAKRLYSGTAVPTWNCSPGPSYTDFYLRTSTGVLYYCTAAPSTWSVFATAGGGGVTSIAGTANQITASAATGAVTLSLPSAITLPGTLTLGGTVSGGGNQVNNVIIGTSTPLAGSFTTLAASSPFTSTQGTITTSQPFINHTATWNNGAVSFTGILSNTTSTASANTSLLMDLQVGGTTKFRVDKNGTAFSVVGFTGIGAHSQVGVLTAGAATAAVLYADTSGTELQGLNLASASLISFSNTTQAYDTKDTTIYKSAPGVIGIGTTGSSPTGALMAGTYRTGTNCADSAGAAACGSAAAGAVVIDASATTVVVSSTAVSATSRIFIQEDSSLGTELGITCNATVATRLYSVTARTAATSFTITTSAAPVATPACLSYHIIN